MGTFKIKRENIKRRNYNSQLICVVMNKPIKPRYNARPPTTIITVCKLLVYDVGQKQYKLIDEVSHPDVFKDPETNEINTELGCYYDELDTLNYIHNMEDLSYSDYKRIYAECAIPANDFTVCHRKNEDGYYEASVVKYEVVDPDYESKLKKYNNRFIEYEELLSTYNKEMEKYTTYKNAEKKQKLIAELNKL